MNVLYIHIYRYMCNIWVWHPVVSGISVELVVHKCVNFPRTDHEGPEGEQRYIYFLLASALNVGGWATPRRNRFTPEKETRYPFYRRLGVRQVQSLGHKYI